MTRARDIELASGFWPLIWRTTWRHQLALAGLSVLVFGMTTGPIEIQRRIVNNAFKGGAYPAILSLALAYLGVCLVLGLTKMVLNIYRGWVGENMVRRLRREIEARIAIDAVKSGAAEAQGIEISLVVAEAEPVGSFAGTGVSDPVLSGGILLSIFGYMLWLQPVMALVALGVLVPQVIVVPWMQGAINRRATRRIGVLREVSVAILDDPASAGSPAQEGRFTQAFELNMGIFKLKFSMNFLMNFMRQAGVASVLALGGWYVVHGQTEVGTVVAFLAGLSEINDPWGDLVNWFRDMSVAKAKYVLLRDAVVRLEAAN